MFLCIQQMLTMTGLSRQPTLLKLLSMRARCKPRAVTSYSTKASGKETLMEVAYSIARKEITKIVVMVGAGISTLSGLPDFRTPGSGIYESMKLFSLDDPSAVFDLGVFSRDPRPFFAVARDLFPDPSRYRPNYVHFLCRVLQDEGTLLRLYTQNIDGLERAAGISEDKLVEAHGTFATATCHSCLKKYTGDSIKEDILGGRIPKCVSCNSVIKPDIVFFGEQLPDRFLQNAADMAQAQLLIVMGTSLQVHPFAGLVDAVAEPVPRILVNQQAVGPFLRQTRRVNDCTVLGNLVHGAERLARVLNYHEKVLRLVSDDCKRHGDTRPSAQPHRNYNS